MSSPPNKLSPLVAITSYISNPSSSFVAVKIDISVVPAPISTTIIFLSKFLL